MVLRALPAGAAQGANARRFVVAAMVAVHDMPDMQPCALSGRKCGLSGVQMRPRTGKLARYEPVADPLISCSPLGKRVIGMPMDTDEDRDERYVLTMRSRDLARLDASYVHLRQNAWVANKAHLALFITFSSKCSICREDTDPAH